MAIFNGFWLLEPCQSNQSLAPSSREQSADRSERERKENLAAPHRTSRTSGANPHYGSSTLPGRWQRSHGHGVESHTNTNCNAIAYGSTYRNTN